MKIIQGVRHPILLPECWEDLTPEQYVYTVTRLLELMAHQCTLVDFHIALLLKFTGYRPSIRLRPTRPEVKVVINENLVRLSELITFPLRTGHKGTEVNNLFRRNPLPEIRIRRTKYKGKQFDIGIVLRTDITAREFADAFDAVRAFAETRSEECLNTLCAILYPALPDHTKNMNSGHYREFYRVNYAIRYSILIWFTGIVQYFSEHPIYRILFSGDRQEEDTARISLGMGETIMHLSLSGFGAKTEMENISLVDYFDLQVKSVKKMIADARAQGAKTEDIAKHTRLSYNLIEQLS